MKRKLLVAISLFVLGSFFVPANAVENGDDATGSGFVVPIRFQTSSTTWGGCSGALIAPRIVVTAGHCVLDSNGLLTKNVYVGVAGSSADSVSLQDKVQSITITSGFQNGAGNRVGDDDLAFLTLSNPQSLQTKVYLASEKQNVDLKSGGSTLKAFGYGYYSSEGNEKISFPKSFSGTFSQRLSKFSNSAYMASTKGDACAGDSGSPILNITASQVTLVGILTGGAGEGKCSDKLSDGNFYALFTLIGRYANLAFASATEAMDSLELAVNSQTAQNKDLNSQITLSSSSLDSLKRQVNSTQVLLDTTKLQLADTQVLLDTSNSKVADLEAQLKSARVANENLQKKLPQTIQCTKGKVTQKIRGVNPKCPKGFTSNP